MLLAGGVLLGVAALVAAVGVAWPGISQADASAPPDVVSQPAVTSLPADAQTVRPLASPVPTPPPLLTGPAAARPLAATPAVAPTPSARLATPAEPPAAASPSPAPTARPQLPPATHIAIPAVGINTKIVEVGYQTLEIDGQAVVQWKVADYAAGHAALSANPGEGGNIVIAGHDDWKGQVFENLYKAKLGDQVTLTTPQKTYRYTITEIHYRKVAGAALSERLAAGMFLAPMPEERVTLVTCWPYGVDSHRLIVVAKPQS